MKSIAEMTQNELELYIKTEETNKFSSLVIFKNDNNGFTSYFVVQKIKETEKAIQFEIISEEILGNTPIDTKPILAKNILFAVDDFEDNNGKSFWFPKSAIKFKTENFRYGGGLISNSNIFSRPFWLK
jgi:hypothetical protein